MKDHEKIEVTSSQIVQNQIVLSPDPSIFFACWLCQMAYQIPGVNAKAVNLVEIARPKKIPAVTHQPVFGLICNRCKATSNQVMAHAKKISVSVKATRANERKNGLVASTPAAKMP